MNRLSLPEMAYRKRCGGLRIEKVGELRLRKPPAVFIKGAGMAIANQHATLLHEFAHGLRFRRGERARVRQDQDPVTAT